MKFVKLNIFEKCQACEDGVHKKWFEPGSYKLVEENAAKFLVGLGKAEYCSYGPKEFKPAACSEKK